MSTTAVHWAGPLFYPPIGKIAVTKSGSRIEVWPDEGDDPGCFTGLRLLPDRTYAERVVWDLSCCWDRSEIDHVEEPTAADAPLCEMGFST